MHSPRTSSPLVPARHGEPRRTTANTTPSTIALEREDEDQRDQRRARGYETPPLRRDKYARIPTQHKHMPKFWAAIAVTNLVTLLQ
jgi:hypothetical protein